MIYLKSLLLFFCIISFAEAKADSLKNAEANITNFHVVDNGIYRGGRPTGGALRILQELGVKNVVDLQGGDLKDSDFGWVAGVIEPGEEPSWINYESRKVKSLGMSFVHVPLNSLDAISVDEGSGIGRLLKFISEPANQPVYIHCEHGVDRTGLVVALYRVYFDHWTRKAAHDEMVEMGHGTINSIVTGDMDGFFWVATKGQP